ncbi:ribulose-phosphate 3-epimerase [Candidatus Neptunichlamydia sp. REUL1]|uniref:ribulose-phosphate 3-epimerase n=1 Tax=Candidatus Neptunichlamydia sp. REUL1 TaxID=3064277 RepID=UPI0029307F7A|nr:ribulose-phosphate 3-epimerase [Candidatus Neptunochlamydia sp. REUL1]
MSEIYIEPSIFAGDFGHLADEAKRAEDAGANAIHFDIMDGHFVPNLSLSPKALAAINKATDIYLDVHIMVYKPFDYIEQLIENGADCITFHIEATEDVEDTLNYIRKCGVHAGLAFCPETSESLIPKYLDKCDKILLMTVHPGFGGQALIPEVLEKIEFTRGLCDRLDVRKGGKVPKEGESLPPFDIQVDGGVDDKTAPLCIKAGANHLVSGTYLFKGEGMKDRIEVLRG